MFFKTRKNKKIALRIEMEERAAQRLYQAATKTADELFEEYETTAEGFDSEQAELMRELYGENVITQKDENTVAKRLFKAFVDPFTGVLTVLALISLFTDVFMAAPGEADPTAVIIVTAMVLISGTLSFVQESKSNRAAEALSDMVETTISVHRSDTGRQEIPISDLVCGDIIHLAAGDMIPADVRLLRAKDLFISLAALTGESEPAEKFSDPAKTDGRDLLGLPNMAFMGSNVISGAARAIVINTGDSTMFGSLAQGLTEEKGGTSFDKGVRSVSWLLIRFMAVMAPVVFLLSGLTGGGWMQAFLFALSVAVGMTPEMLPVIVSSNLAKSASKLSKQKVIVKKLGSIQNFGAMDVLCTDKTGTLTQDRVVLMHSLDIHGERDERVLKHAVLNSYYQTGLKNLMDVAVLEYAESGKAGELWKGYRKVDEIPFDFSRRRMSVVVADGLGKTQMITKGAAEEMLSICTHAMYKGVAEPLTPEIEREVREIVEQYNGDGMRMLLVAQKTNPNVPGAFSVEDEAGMMLLGSLAFLDPPKDSSRSAIEALNAHGVAVKVLTGDNDGVTKTVCKQVGIDADRILLGADLESMSDEELEAKVEKYSVFAKLSPQQKVRIVAALKRQGHTVGFLGDGINDAPAMKEADVGISVDTAVDIAKESADIILLEKDLNVLEQGVLEGRKTYGNIIKYIKMTASSNFGNMFSVLAASAFLPFLPMLPIHLIALSLIYDLTCITMPWDNMDAEFLNVPRKWDASSIKSFMIIIGPPSSLFDLLTFGALYWFICPAVFGGAYGTLDAAGKAGFEMLFHTAWFVESLWTQTMAIHMLRSPKLPFIKSRASMVVTIATFAGVAAGTALPYTPLGAFWNMSRLPGEFFIFLAVVLVSYLAVTTVAKKLYIRKYGELL